MLKTEPKFETWEDEWAMRHILMPSAMFLCLWVLIASIWAAGEVNGKGDLGLAFLSTNWMFFHIFIALFTFPALVISGCKFDQMPWLSGMLLCCYTLHQFEEHAWDIFGNRFNLIYMLGRLICPSATLPNRSTMTLDSEGVFLKTTGCGRVNEQTILWINVYGIMGLFLVVLLLPKERQPFAVCQNMMMAGLNALLFHILNFLGMWAKTGSAFEAYNPGLVQSVLLNLPFTFYAMYRMRKAGWVSTCHIVITLLTVGIPGFPLLFILPMFSVANEWGWAWVDHLMVLTPMVLLFLVTFAVEPTERSKKLK